MSEQDVCIVDVMRDGKRMYFVAKACSTNSVLKCLLSEEQEDVRQHLQAGAKVRLRIMSTEFARSEPLIRVRVLSFLETQAGALDPGQLPEAPQAGSPADGVCGPERRKRIFFDLLQESI